MDGPQHQHTGRAPEGACGTVRRCQPCARTSHAALLGSVTQQVEKSNCHHRSPGKTRPWSKPWLTGRCSCSILFAWPDGTSFIWCFVKHWTVLAQQSSVVHWRSRSFYSPTVKARTWPRTILYWDNEKAGCKSSSCFLLISAFLLYLIIFSPVMPSWLHFNSALGMLCTVQARAHLSLLSYRTAMYVYKAK